LLRRFAPVNVIVPVEPALNVEVVPLDVVRTPCWLMEPPVEVTSKRLAVVVGRRTLPVVALKVAGPLVVMLPVVELMLLPLAFSVPIVEAPANVRVPDVVILAKPAAVNENGMAGPVATAVGDPPPRNETTGVPKGYPEPAAPSVTPEITLVVVLIAAVAVAPVPAPVIATVGTCTYAEPPEPNAIEPIGPEPRPTVTAALLAGVVAPAPPLNVTVGRLV
jgi:hypothetical protein